MQHILPIWYFSLSMNEAWGCSLPPLPYNLAIERHPLFCFVVFCLPSFYDGNYKHQFRSQIIIQPKTCTKAFILTRAYNSQGAPTHPDGWETADPSLHGHEIRMGTCPSLAGFFLRSRHRSWELIVIGCASVSSWDSRAFRREFLKGAGVLESQTK